MDYKQLKLLYEQFYNISKEIDTTITNEDYDNVVPLINKRDKLLSYLSVMKKELNPNEKLPEDINDLIEKIKIQETSNIKRLTNIKDSLKIEIEKINKGAKIVAAYEPSDNEVASIVDVTE